MASTGALFALFGYWNLRLQKQHSEETVLQSADRISDVIRRSTHYQMLRNDRDALYERWTAFPKRQLDYRSDVKYLTARRWPTVLSKEQF
ncbi:MAG TPA: putative oxidoreductase C-terminal domain-containing protein, partial [Candidatus Acidoferrales bacterium]|nr:putative oxidoreductase C-terminal domain-containing protein [Candidatus Acidoferrales bacterium]